MMSRIWLILLFVRIVSANLLSAGILSETVPLRPKNYQMIGFAQSALNQTEVEIRLSCVEESVDMVFQVQYALRSSPCDKEFFDAKRADNLRKLLTFYFSDPDHIPDAYSYDKMVYYKSSPQNFSCKVSSSFAVRAWFYLNLYLYSLCFPHSTETHASLLSMY
ncbi:hypothetical protein ANCCAN_28567 [Ancylostoma caninum]|uniref:ZP domain-containing protein n=1 Tax=Ancylostoma caninum TaxID=29170 RepID=A0A368F245_ANCCA|nr:hypothetical protein ANCCAN_28567 [Ancylostoma caninum]